MYFLILVNYSFYIITIQVFTFIRNIPKGRYLFCISCDHSESVGRKVNVLSLCYLLNDKFSHH